MSNSSRAARPQFDQPPTIGGSFIGPGQFDAYRQLYSPGADVDRLGVGFYAHIRSRVNGSIVVTNRRLKDIAHNRDLNRIGQDAFDHVTIGFIASGTLILHTESRPNVVGEGCVFMLDMTRPARYAAQCSMTTVSLPRSLLPPAASLSGVVHGLCLTYAQAAPLWRWLRLSSLNALGAVALEDALARVLNDAEALGLYDVSQRRRDQAREMIEARLAEQDRSAQLLAHQLGMSRATLYRTFEPLGSIQRWRQKRRLLRLKALLAFTDMPIGQAAQVVGFEHAAHASALFSRTFEISPSRFRLAMKSPDGEGGETADLRRLFENIPAIMLREQALASSARG